MAQALRATRPAGPVRPLRSSGVGQSKAIDKIDVGDLVWAQDLAGSTTVARPVTRLFRHADRPVVSIHIRVEGQGLQRVVATVEHPFWIVGRGWVPAARMQRGDRLRALLPGFECIVDTVTAEPAPATVFNVEVAEVHNYFVGRAGVLVHNASQPAGIDPGFPLPRPGSPAFSRLVDEAQHQFVRTKSHAMLGLPQGAVAALQKERIGPFDNAAAAARVSAAGHAPSQATEQARYSVSAFPGGSAAARPLGDEQNQVVEDFRLWAHELMAQSFGTKAISRSMAQVRYSNRPLGQGEDWHADGGPVTFGVSLAVEGVGTELLAPQPVFHRHEDYKYLDAAFSPYRDSWASAPYLPTPTGSILVFAAQGVARHYPLSDMRPLIHRGPPVFDGDRFLYLVRAYDGGRS